MSGSHAGERRARRLAHPVRWIVLGLVIVLVALVAWIGIRGWLASEHLKRAVPLADTVQSQVLSGDGAAALRSARELQGEVHAARDLTGDIVWRGAEVVPFVGDDLRAVRQVSEALSGVADDAIVPVSTIASTVGVDAFKPVDGAINLQPLVDAQPAIDKADGALKRELARASSIDADGTVGPVRDAVRQLVDVLTKASGQVDTVARAVDLAPAMLGADGPREYLVLFQNNAELRATGGNPGATALLRADGGKLSLVQQASSGDFPRLDQPALPLPVETQGLYGAITGQFIQDVNLTPQFPLSAQLAAEMWKRQFGTSVDGVLSIDPVALSYLLTATGPITLPTGDVITSENVVSLLLNDVYKRYAKPADQDLFFEGTAAGVFSAVSSGNLDPKALVAALAKAGEERRVYLWSADTTQQARIAETTLAGELPTSTEKEPRFGVYLNDGTGSKMDYYLGVSIAVGQAVCRQDGRPTYVVDVTLTNNAPADAATSLPTYITGGGAFGTPAGLISTNVSIYAPKDGVFVQAVNDGKPAALQTATDTGLSVAQFQSTLSPGQSTTWRLEFLGGAAGTGMPSIEKTPLVNQTETKELNVSCESPLT
ncbi:DUF4012 domain-containing protein [Frigoribacterium sp. 2-23]|uniref:DUF4012 domain-containing protein n=1 Tax=Frigoribacterium sp. 2-23 TaxID=3415006 RepID=UPI003C6FB4F2